MQQPVPLAEKWQRLRVLSDSAEDRPPLDVLFVSDNEKTGLSLNVDVVRSCRFRTAGCARYCYALSGPAAFPDAVVRYRQNYERLRCLGTVMQATVDAEADRIAGLCRRQGRDFFRVNGVGDLLPGTVRLVQALAVRHPWLTVWVSSRDPELLVQLPGSDNVHVMMSTDATTPPAVWSVFENAKLVGHGNAFIAYTRVSGEDRAPDSVDIVFELHVGACRARWEPDVRACRATVRGGAEHQAACVRCRRCFDRAARMRWATEQQA